MKKKEWSLHILIGIIICIYTKYVIDNFIMYGLVEWIQFLIFSIAIFSSFTLSAMLHKWFKYDPPFNESLQYVRKIKRQNRLKKRRKTFNIKRKK